MDITLLLKAILMGVVEGLTEFLPVSSTGHLIIVGSLIQFPGNIAPSFEIFIQLGAVLALIVYLGRDLIDLLKSAKQGDGRSRRLLLCLLIAVLPAATIGVLFNRWIKANVFNALVVSIMLLLGGLLMLWVERRHLVPTVTDIRDVTPGQAILVGIAQTLALIPGTSRTMTTIVGGLLGGLDRKTAVRFSFYLSIPTMLGATMFDLLTNFHKIPMDVIPAFAVGLLTSFVVALIVARFFLHYVAHNSLKPFAWYRIAVQVVLALLAAANLLVYTGVGV